MVITSLVYLSAIYIDLLNIYSINCVLYDKCTRFSRLNLPFKMKFEIVFTGRFIGHKARMKIVFTSLYGKPI